MTSLIPADVPAVTLNTGMTMPLIGFGTARLSDEAARHVELDVVTEPCALLFQGRLLEDPVLLDLAARHGVTAAQVVPGWHLQR
jgi:diketogulonate reductase-like aldo/keto reductase